jgi:phosphatidylglycerophosphatase A
MPEHWTGAGLIGSIMGLVFVWLGFPLVQWKGFLSLLVLTAAGIAVSGRAEKLFKIKDDPRIIVDEILGFFWSVAFIPLGSFGVDRKLSILLAALVLFRFFDIYKIPSRRVQNLKGGWGVVLDDVLSGASVNLILQVALRIIG